MSATPSRKRRRKEANPLPWVILVITLIVAAIWFVSRGSKPSPRTAKTEDTMTILLPPPPPPVQPKLEPPPPKEEPPQEEVQEELVQEQVDENEQPPDESPPEPPSEDLGGGSKGGTGPAIGGGRGTGNRIGSSGGRNSSKFGWYAAKVQSTIREALGRHPSTRSATMSLQVRVWADSNGRITRAQLVGSSGNLAVDESIKNQVLTGLMLPQAPPADMPMPINLRITARKSAS